MATAMHSPIVSTACQMHTGGTSLRLFTSFLLYVLLALVHILPCANGLQDDERLPPFSKGAFLPHSNTTDSSATGESQNLFQSSISCGTSEFYVQLTFSKPFKGLLYAYRIGPSEDPMPGLNYPVQILDTCTLRGNGASIVYLELSFLSECVEKLSSTFELTTPVPELLVSKDNNTNTTQSTPVANETNKFNLDGFNFRRALDHSHAFNISSDQMYQLSLYVQSDANIEQKTDSKVTIQCSSQATKNIIFEQNLSTDYSRRVDSQWRLVRATKSRTIVPSAKLVLDPAWRADEGHAQMDIFLGRGKVPFVKTINKTVELGDDLTAIIRVSRRDGLDSRVSRCFAHSTDSTVRRELTNEYGCPLDGSPMPAFKVLHQAGSQGTESQVHYTSFAAFKFADSGDLRIECQLEFCRQSCGEVSCENATRTR